MTAYYNEFDPKAAAWLRELIRQGHIAPGEVDERSIADVRPDDLRGFRQCHFFAGIGVWSYALRRAGIADDTALWTGSCPCQPFSAAGKGDGVDDERHLWPHMHHLIDQCRPGLVLGEQVASKDGLGWLDLVQADLEGSGYASRAVDLCAAGVGAPHIRQRLWWVAERLGQSDGPGRIARGLGAPAARYGGATVAGSSSGIVEYTEGDRRVERRAEPGERSVASGRGDCGVSDTFSERGCSREPRGEDAGNARFASQVCGLADADGGNPGPERQQRGGEQRQQPEDDGSGFVGRSGLCGLADAERGTSGRRPREASGAQDRIWRIEEPGHHGSVDDGANRRPGPTNGFWRDVDWLFCRDGKWRPVESGTFPLAHGAPARVGRLRGYGNAIVAEAAIAFIEAYFETKNHFARP